MDAYFAFFSISFGVYSRTPMRWLSIYITIDFRCAVCPTWQKQLYDKTTCKLQLMFIPILFTLALAIYLYFALPYSLPSLSLSPSLSVSLILSIALFFSLAWSPTCYLPRERVFRCFSHFPAVGTCSSTVIIATHSSGWETVQCNRNKAHKCFCSESPENCKLSSVNSIK